MDPEINPEQLDKIQKFLTPEGVKKLLSVFNFISKQQDFSQIPGDKLEKLELILNQLSGSNPQYIQFKCKNCGYQADHSKFK